MDYGHKYADEQLKKLEKRLAKEYRQASLEMEQKAKDFFTQFEAKDKDMQKLLEDKQLTNKEYLAWRQREMLTGEQYTRMRDELAYQYTNVNKIAASMINENNISIYALNYNFGLYEVESATNAAYGFTLYDVSTVKRLLKDDPKLLPQARVKIAKDQLWNKKKINSALLQGVLQGDSIDGIAGRLRTVTNMNQTSAVRNARTMTTGSENGGRVAAYQRAKDMGIDCKQMWLATLDGRTRHSHRMLDREKVDVGDAFSNGCRFPGDPDGVAEEVYNCRCTLVADIAGIDYEDTRTSEMAYDDWKKGKRGMK